LHSAEGLILLNNCIVDPVPKDLSKGIKREHYKIPTMQEIAIEFAGKTVFSTLDLQIGYRQVLLDEESSLLCTFSIPFG